VFFFFFFENRNPLKKPWQQWKRHGMAFVCIFQCGFRISLAHAAKGS